MSALTGEGIDTLASELVRRSFGTNPYSERGAAIATEHQRASLAHAGERLRAAAALVRAGSGERELIAAELRAAIGAVEELLGVVSSDEVLDRIFAQFCIGK